MAQFSLESYETVDQRIRRFYKDHQQGRITTDLVDFRGEPGKTRWVVKASVWRDRTEGDPDGTGFAFENDGAGMANKTSALENCETSAIGRALAQIGYSGDKRATREEMAKVQAQQKPQAPYQPSQDFLELIQSATTKDEKNAIWQQAISDGADQVYLDKLRQAGNG